MGKLAELLSAITGLRTKIGEKLIYLNNKKADKTEIPSNYVTTNTNQTGLSGNKSVDGTWAFNSQINTSDHGNSSQWKQAYDWGDFRDYNLGRTSSSPITDFSSIDANFETRIQGVTGTFFGIGATARPQGLLSKGGVNTRWSYLGTTDSGVIRIFATNSSNSNTFVEVIHTDNLDSQATALGFIKSSALSGYVPTSRTITINGVTQNLSANRTWTIPDNNTITRLRGTASGTFTSGDLTLLEGAGIDITQSGANLTITNTSPNIVQTLTVNNTSVGTLSISGGGAVNLNSLRNISKPDADVNPFTSNQNGFYSYNVSGTTSGYPASLGGGILYNRNNNNTICSIDFFKAQTTGVNELWFRVGNTSTSWFDYERVASREWVLSQGFVTTNEINNIYDQLSAKANTRLSNVVSDLSNSEKTTIKNKIGIEEFSSSTSVIKNGNSFERAALIGDITTPQNNNVSTISPKAVTNAKMANMVADRIKGRTSTTGIPQDLTPAQVRSMLNVAEGATQTKVGSNGNNFNVGNINLKSGNNVTIQQNGNEFTFSADSGVDNRLSGLVSDLSPTEKANIRTKIGASDALIPDVIARIGYQHSQVNYNDISNNLVYNKIDATGLTGSGEIIDNLPIHITGLNIGGLATINDSSQLMTVSDYLSLISQTDINKYVKVLGLCIKKEVASGYDIGSLLLKGYLIGSFTSPYHAKQRFAFMSNTGSIVFGTNQYNGTTFRLIGILLSVNTLYFNPNMDFMN